MRRLLQQIPTPVAMFFAAALAPVAFAQTGHIPMRLLLGSEDRIEACDPAPCDSPTVVSAVPLEGRFIAYRIRLGANGDWWRFDHIRFVHGVVSSGGDGIRGAGRYRVIDLIEGPFQSAGFTLQIGGGEVEFISGQAPRAGDFPNFLSLDASAAFVGNTRQTLRIVAAPTCFADFDDGSGRGVLDGGVTIDDLLYFLRLYEAGDIAADIDDGTGLNTPDEAVTIDDLLAFLEAFERGC